MMSPREIIERLPKGRWDAQRRRGTACCPCHDDIHPSLSVWEKDGKTMAECHAGCDWRDVRAALGLDSETINGSSLATSISATYDYCDEEGHLLYQVVRSIPKDFRQRRPDGQGDWIWNVKGVRRVPYRLFELQSKVAHDTVLIVEGEKDVDRLANLGHVATCNAGGAGKWTPELNDHFRDKTVYLLSDNDEPGRDHAQDVAAKLAPLAREVRTVQLPDLPEKGDVSDWLDQGGDPAKLIDICKSAPQWTSSHTSGGSSDVSATITPVIDLIDFNFVELPAREKILDPVLDDRAIMEVAGFRGIGKTYIGLSMAACIATGSNFLKWQAPTPRRVLYLDGEMAGAELQERTKAITEAFGIPERGYFTIWTPDIAQRVPDLSTEDGQAMIEPWLEGVEVLFIDSISTLCRTGVEDRAEDWKPVQDWLLRLKRRGISTVLFHHTGWNTDRGRGTSKREDVLNTVVLLKAVDDRGDGETRFEIRLTKKRGIHGRAATPIEAQFCIRDGRIEWTYIECADADMELVTELSQDGMTQRQISSELGMAVGKVNKLLKRRKTDQS